MTTHEDRHAASSASVTDVPMPAAPARLRPHDVLGERVSTVCGDRYCTGCGYNLIGQPVVREPHYRMLIVRCAECGTAASLQEYPLLGRWAGRLAMLLVALWLAALVALWTLGGIMLLSASWALGEAAAANAVATVSNEWGVWYQQQMTAAAAAAAATGAAPRGFAMEAAKDWWKIQGGWEGFVAARGGWWKVVRWEALAMLLPLGLGAMTLGVLWSVALLGLPRRRLPWIALAMLTLPAGAMAIMDVSSFGNADGWYYGALMGPVQRSIEAPFRWGALACATGPLIVGLWFGRPLARAAVRFFLPPRLRHALSFLWLSEGLTPPRG